MRTHLRLFVTAVVLSAFLNCGMIVISLVGSLAGRSFLTLIGDAIAAPPGFIIERTIRQGEHSVAGFVTGAAESLAFSIAFYSVATLLVLEGLAYARFTPRRKP